MPVHKKNEKNLKGNYRPISLLPIFGKILEKLIYNSLYSHLESHELLEVALLSALVSRELPFCKTTLLGKQLISPVLFGRSKIGKKDVVLYSLCNRKICKSQCFLLGWLCKLFFKTFR